MAMSLEHPLALLVLVAAASFVPFALLGLTCFVKISVVFAILRNALGAQQVPSGMVLSAMALVLTLFVMEPTLRDVSSAATNAWQQRSVTAKSRTAAQTELTVDDLGGVLAAGAEPLAEFLQKHTGSAERDVFQRLRSQADASKRARQADVPEGKQHFHNSAATDFFTLVPAFVTTELKEAFTIGVVLFMPFLVVDLLVANILMGLGMVMVSPVSISLPFKLLLFVLCDGWTLLCQGLVNGYA